ncbi:hypothetical protein TURU_008149 [Turdus rufiventris]|nr:hypothetical protein TURU_008149 [Turdus rufiventris]
MEGPPATAALSGADKEKLREKLALLRREYSETVIRLRVQTKTCSEADTENTRSVTVKDVPEFSSDEVGPQDSSRAESFQASQEIPCCGVIRPVPVEKKPQTSRGMMKLRRRTKESKEREPVCDVHLTSADEMMKNQIASAEELQSPVFRRSSLSHTEESAQRAPGALLVQGEGDSFTPDAPSGLVQDVFEGSATAQEPEPSPHALRDSRDIWQPGSSGAVATPDRCEPCSQHGHSVLLDPRGDGGEESPSIIKQVKGQSLCEDQGESHGLLDLMSENEILLDSRNNTITEENKSHEGHQGDANTLNPCPADNALDNAEELLGNEQAEGQAGLSPPDRAAAPEGTLSSCTVVEGLLFPVEYYVRTTRRMSNCQRKVDLDAVILSQLGRSKKGGSSRGQSCPMGSQGPAALGLPAVDPNTRGSLFSFRSLQWLLPQLGIRDFHLPNEEFGILKLEKLKSSPVNDLEDFVSGHAVAPEDTPDAQMMPKEKGLRSTEYNFNFELSSFFTLFMQKKDVAEQLTPVLPDGPGEESLQFVSELKIPVIQIVPLPDTCNLVCVALGELEIGEIRLLLYSSETDSFEHSLVKAGNIKAVVGLKDQRLVSSSRTMQEQQVEMVSLSETGRSRDRQTLMPPEETVTAFAEVEGMREALVGTTAGNSVVVWYLEGDVWDTAGAAVLTSGAVAVWDLLRGRCTAVLPAGPAGHWALARWAGGGAGLLAGHCNGTVHLYRYRPPQPGAA